MVQGVKYPNYINELYQPKAGREAFNYLYKLYTKYVPSDIAIAIIKKDFFIGYRHTILREGINPQSYTDKYNMNKFWDQIRESLQYE